MKRGQLNILLWRLSDKLQMLRYRMFLTKTRHSKLIRILAVISVVCILVPFLLYQSFHGDDELAVTPGERKNNQVRNSNGNTGEGVGLDAVTYDKNIPLIWIGGVPRSGTTLARAMLDAHPDIRCGEETRIIPRMLSMHGNMLKSDIERKRLDAAKVSEGLLNSALGAYMLTIIVGHGEPAKRLCNKDPFTLKSIPRLMNIFPQSKFILMIRDGRATVHSIVTRQVTIRGFDHKSYAGGLKDWNKAIDNMYTACQKEGPTRCLPVFYEQLVLHPKKEMKRILKFLEIDWNESVLHHEQAVGKAGGISLSEKELSTDQVNKPVNLGALTKWVDHFPEDLKKDINRLAPMLAQLGYDTQNYPPFYGTPDPEVFEQSKRVEQQRDTQ